MTSIPYYGKALDQDHLTGVLGRLAVYADKGRRALQRTSEVASALSLGHQRGELRDTIHNLVLEGPDLREIPTRPSASASVSEETGSLDGRLCQRRDYSATIGRFTQMEAVRDQTMREDNTIGFIASYASRSRKRSYHYGLTTPLVVERFYKLDD